MKEFGELIRVTRENRGMTGVQLASHLGVAHSTLVRLERGQAAYLPDPALVRAIANVLGISQEALLRAAGYLVGEKPAEYSPQVAQLAPIIDTIDWDASPGRVEQAAFMLRGFLEADRIRRELDT